MIPYGRQEITEEDIQAVVNVLRSDYLTQGPCIEQFEQSLAQKVGAEHAIAVSNGTAALHLACLALDIQEKDIVWTSPISFVASINCALYLKASIDFVDIDPLTRNLSVDALEEKLKKAKITNRLPKLLIVVHFSGAPCEMESIDKLSKYYGFKVIEDACHALGSTYQGKSIGQCCFSELCIYSFHPVKNITTGEGGAIVTNDYKLSAKLKRLRSHGITRNSIEMGHPIPGEWYYEMIDLGYNYRITDIQAALGTSQLKKLDDFIQKRTALAQKYLERLKHPAIQHPNTLHHSTSAWHIYVIEIKSENPLIKRDLLFSQLRSRNIGVQVHYIPIHLHPYFKKLGFNQGDFPLAENYYKNAITIPLYPRMDQKNQDYVINTLLDLLDKKA